MTNETIAAKKPRLGWLDALRGFTMILVVTNHVALKSFGMQIRWSAALQFFLLFRMPLFFFISGLWPIRRVACGMLVHCVSCR